MNMADGLNMQPRAQTPQSPFIVPGMGVPCAAPADLRTRPRETAIEPLSIQFPPLTIDTSSPIPQPPGIALQQPASWQYDWTSLDGVTGISRATYPGMVNFSSSQSTPTIPVSVAQGGTGQTSFSGPGVVCVFGTPPATQTMLQQSPLPVSFGGTGLATFSQGMFIAPVGGQMSTTPYGANVFSATDASGAALTFTNNNCYSFNLGNFCWCYFTGTYPSTGSSANAIIGGCPFTPVIGGIPVLVHCTPAGFFTVAGVMQANGTVALFGGTGSNQANSGMSGVQFSFWIAFQHT